MSVLDLFNNVFQLRKLHSVHVKDDMGRCKKWIRSCGEGKDGGLF